MSHFAEIDKDGNVLRVVVGSDNDKNEGYDWLVENLGGNWVKTSYNTIAGEHKLGGTPLRKNFAGVGYKYDKDRDAFLPPKPYENWTLNETTCTWDAPVTKPESNLEDGEFYEWDVDKNDWVKIKRR